MSTHPHSSSSHRGLTTSPCQQTQLQHIFNGNHILMADHCYSTAFWTATPFCHNSFSTVCRCAELKDRCAVLPQQLFDRLELRPCAAALFYHNSYTLSLACAAAPFYHNSYALSLAYTAALIKICVFIRFALLVLDRLYMKPVLWYVVFVVSLYYVFAALGPVHTCPDMLYDSLGNSMVMLTFAHST